MKKSLLFILSILTIGSLFAQPCVPDPNFVSLGVGVYPLPYNVALIDSGYVGVEDTAIVGQDYAFAFTAVVPSTLLNGTVDLFSVTIESVENLPEGLNYECDLPDCIFTPAVPGDPTSGLGCVSISGVTTAAPGSYSIIVNTIASTNLGDISVAFPADPNDNFFNLPEGDYAIHVAEGDTTGSGGTSVMNYSERISTMKNFPNPFASETAISFTAESAGPVLFEVYGISGQKVHSEEMTMKAGENEIIFNGSQLAEGSYIYGLTGKDVSIMNKFSVNR